MNKKRIIALLTAMVLMVGMLAACGGGGEEPATSADPAASGEPAETGYKDTITIAVGSDQNYMDGQMNNTNDVLLRSTYSQLVRRGADNEIEGDLAESWEVSEDGTVWTFNLRQDVYFHSGKQLTSADVKASYDRLLDEENYVRYTALATGYLKECVAVDEFTVQLVTETPIAAMLANLCHRSNLILNADYIAEYGIDLGLSAESVDGTGPYKLVSWDLGEQMTLERNEEYFRGPVATENINVLVVSDASARLVALETEQVDITTVATSDIPALLGNEALKVEMIDSIGAHGLQFNCAHEYLSDTKLRQAVSYAIDRQSIIDVLYSDIGETAARAPLNENVWGFHDFGVIEQDQELAKELMAEAGYPDGFEFSIMVYTGYNKSLETCEMIVADLAEVGITATIEPVDNATFSASMGGRAFPGDNFEWGMFFMGYGAGTADADEGLRRIWTTSPDGNNNNNYGWYSNERVDELLLAAASEMDEEVRLEMYKEAQQILYIDDPAAVFTNDRMSVWSMNSKIEGFAMNVNSVIFWDDLKCAE